MEKQGAMLQLIFFSESGFSEIKVKTKRLLVGNFITKYKYKNRSTHFHWEKKCNGSRVNLVDRKSVGPHSTLKEKHFAMVKNGPSLNTGV